jgi:rod shape-determining protein MreD
VPIAYSTGKQVEVYHFNWVVAVVAPLLALFLQAFIPLKLHFFSMFDLPLLVTIYFAMARRNPISGLLTGSVIGLLQDALTHQPIGVYGIAKTVVGFAASFLSAKIDLENPGSRLLLTLGFYVVHQVVYFAVARGMVGLTLAWSWERELGATIANAILGAVVYALLDRFRERA